MVSLSVADMPQCLL
uniref:Uncharacterized protein n=1 Tax=Moniliophthora roreri TaxID=221103 RepID=A0A0W0FNZ9_MONRR